MSFDAEIQIPDPVNEPVKPYGPGSSEKRSLKARLDRMAGEKVEIPLIIGGKEIHTREKRKIVMPHDHGHVLAEFSCAGAPEMKMAIDSAAKAKKTWERMPWHERAGVFLKAAELLAGPWRDTINASTMLGQSKNVHQAEIDAACEMIDFFRFNAKFYEKILRDQPLSAYPTWNRLDYRPLEGFVLAITPFNFTSIAGNLGAAPAMLGNTVLWKPSDTQVLSAYYTMKLFEAAGLPSGVINFIPADGPLAGQSLLPHPDLGGVHFTGSTATFRQIWSEIGRNISSYRSYPRLVGETGGKDFVFAHPSAELDVLVAALVRGAYEYQGQKCSAASRAYVPKSLWPKLKDRLVSEVRSIKTGDVRDFSNFMNAVIDERAFKKIQSYVEFAKGAQDAEILVGGECDSTKGYFIEPSVVLTENPRFKTMVEEIFGPVLTVYVYEDSKLDQAIELCDQTAAYGLTGAIIAQDRDAQILIAERLRYAAGNLYFNDKPTGAVVGQQPFGGARASGTNDKAGSYLNLLRWISPRTIKEVLNPVRDFRYPYLGEK